MASEAQQDINQAEAKQDASQARSNQTPNWLAPQSRQAIQNQATKTIGAAYAPAYQGLGQQAKQAQGLSDKRTADNKYYNTWLDSQMATLQSHAEASNVALQNMQNNLTAHQQGLYAQQGTGGAGAGSINANSLQSNQQANQGMLMNASQQALSNIGTSNNDLNATHANNFAYVQAGQDKQLANLQTALTNISNARSKLDTSQKGDIAKEVARLQGVEISKAQSNRSFQAASQKLGLTAQLGFAKLAQSNTNNLRTTGTSASNNANTNATSRANNAANNATRSAIAAARAGNHSPATTQKIDGGISSVRGLLNQYGNYGYHDGAAYALLVNGGNVLIRGQQGGTGANKPYYKYFPPQKLPTEILNAGYNLRNGGNGLSPGDAAWLQSVGLNPGNYGYQPGAARAVGQGVRSVTGAVPHIKLF